jgi:cytochrome c5
MSHGESSGGNSNAVGMAIAVSVGTLLVIIGIILLAKYAVDSHSVGAGSRAVTPEAVTERIAPVAKLAVEGGPAVKSSVAVPPPPAVAAVSTSAPAKLDGKTTYETACVACHGAGIAGAPKTGDKLAWGPRVKLGTAVLQASALKGKGAMPPKGGNTSLPDEAVKAAVEYMLAQVK